MWTARISTKDPDAFNITRKTGHPDFAPSWALLGPVLRARRAGEPSTLEQWKAYAKAYVEEMQRSHTLNRGAWDLLLSRKRVVLTCYCTDPTRCHRTLLGRILGQLGASFKGELPAPVDRERENIKLLEGLDQEESAPGSSSQVPHDSS